MRIARLSWVLATSLSWFCGGHGHAGETETSVETALAKWEEASRKCQSLDAKLTIFRYNVFWRDRPEITQGRFYYESPRIGYCELREPPSGTNGDRSRPQATLIVVWQGERTLWIEPDRHSCVRVSAEEFRFQLEGAEGGRFGLFSKFAGQVLRRLSGPQRYFPFLVAVQEANVRQRFDLTLGHRDNDKVFLKAIPKQTSDESEYREIDVILDANTYLTRAVRMVSSDGRECTDIVLEDPNINEKPNDRDQLIEPDLSGFLVTEASIDLTRP